MPKGVKTFVFKVQCYGMYCFGTYFTHTQRWKNLRVQSATESSPSVHNLHIDNVRVHSATQWTASVHTLHMPKASQSCDILCVQSATEWIASVHNLHVPKAVITFVFKVLRNGLLRYILYICPKL